MGVLILHLLPPTRKKVAFLFFNVDRVSNLGKFSAVLTHRQGRHLPWAHHFQGPLNSLMCLITVFFITLRWPKNEKELHYLCFLVKKKSFNSQGTRKANKKIHFMGPLIYVLPRAPKGLKTALGKCQFVDTVIDIVFTFCQFKLPAGI